MCQVDNMFHILKTSCSRLFKNVLWIQQSLSLLNLDCYCKSIGYFFASLSVTDDWIQIKCKINNNKNHFSFKLIYTWIKYEYIIKLTSF